MVGEAVFEVPIECSGVIELVVLGCLFDYPVMADRPLCSKWFFILELFSEGLLFVETDLLGGGKTVLSASRIVLVMVSNESKS